MMKPPRTILALAAGSLLLGLSGAGAAAADQGPMHDGPSVYPQRYTTGKVVSRGPLTVRSYPSTRARAIGKVYPHEKLALVCKERGERVAGNDIWFLLDREDGREPIDGGDGIDDGRQDNGRGDNGRDDNGRDDNGREDNGRDDNGRDDNRGDDSRKDRRYEKEAWVSARYVDNLTPVQWCRL
ncbi:hypothetical protein ACFWBI_01555 [Streptomyces sp. NPDC059982]|uniref:hypothetical protein n=1 Tax=unclassified Streptomyces TaxID=2593676 RepID=UPI0036BFC438